MNTIIRTLALVTVNYVDTADKGKVAVWTTHVDYRRTTDKDGEDCLTTFDFDTFDKCMAAMLSLSLRRLGDTNIFVADSFLRFDCFDSWRNVDIVFELDEKDPSKSIYYRVPFVTDRSQYGIWLNDAAARVIIDEADSDSFDNIDTTVDAADIDFALQYFEVFQRAATEEDVNLVIDLVAVLAPIQQNALARLESGIFKIAEEFDFGDAASDNGSDA